MAPPPDSERPPRGGMAPPPGMSGSKYSPLMDPMGPYFFYPQHCFSTNADMYNSTVIAYVKQGN